MSTQRYVAECLLDSERQVDPDEPDFYGKHFVVSILPRMLRKNIGKHSSNVLRDGFADDVSGVCPGNVADPEPLLGVE